MASYSIGAVRSGIASVLNAVSSLKVVYDYPNPEIQGYPAAIFVFDSEKATMLDDASNQRVLSFKIWIACEVAVNGLTAADALLDGVSTDVIDALESISNQSLGGACDWMIPVQGSRQQVNSPEGNMLFQELNLDVHIASSIT